MRWEDEWGGAQPPGPIRLASGTDEIALQSISLQSGGAGHNPYESVGSLATFDVMVAHRGGPEPDWVKLVGWGPTRLTLNSSGAGSIINPAESASPGMLAVGAAPWYDVNALSNFSSRGPTPDGRIKPELVAANCGETATGGGGFCGTSQAAPHVAGMAALVRQRFPNYTPAQVVSYLKDNAEQRISNPDPNNDWGHGFFVLPPVTQPSEPPATVPGAPSLASVTPGTGSLTVVWRAPHQTGSATITAYDIRHIRSDATSKADRNWTVVSHAGTGSGALSRTLTGLTSGASYDVQVRAVNDAGEGPWSATASGTPSSPVSVPGAPIFVSVRPGEGSLSVVWNPPLIEGGTPLTAWKVRHIRSDAASKADANWEVARLLPSGTGRLGYSIFDLPGRIRYDVQVRAINSVGEGPWSATASGTPPDQSVCENSNVVPNASVSPQLVADCETLLALRDTLRGTGTLKWSATTPMRNWNGIRIGGSPFRVTSFRIQSGMTGVIPPELGNLTGLTLLDLSYNQMTGSIPSAIGNLPNLEFLYLHGNRLTGAIPGELGNLSKLEILYLWSNQLTGTIPARLSGDANLRELSFSDNRLQGSIPTSFGRMSKLTSLAMARSRLTGAIPPELENLANLTSLMLSGNQLTGCIPAALKKVQENDLANLVLPDCAAPAPDLVVDAPTVSTGTPAAGAQFTLNATVRNQGNEASVFTTLRYYQSTDQTITTGDTSIGTDSVSSLNASASEDESISVTVPDTPGTYHYGACVDSVSDESDTANNCSPAVTVTVGAAPAPDLVVDTPTVSERAPAAGASFTLNATVRKQGNAASSSTTLRYYRSTDANITTGDTREGTGSVPGIIASASEEESVSLTAPSETSNRGSVQVTTTAETIPGTYYYGACVQPVSGETDTTNNCSDSVAATVGDDDASAPGAPTGLTATADGQTEIDLSWSAPSDDGGADITGYKIEVSTNGSSWSDLVADTNSTSTSHSHTGLTAASTRHYRVSAINSEGSGPASDSDSATTDSAPVQATTCSVDLLVRPGGSCTYPGRSDEFSVYSSGRGSFLHISANESIEIRNTNINGVTYTLVASKHSDGTWKIEEVG